MRSLVALALAVTLIGAGCGCSAGEGPRPAHGTGSEAVTEEKEEGGIPTWVWWGVGIAAVPAVTSVVLLAVALDDLDFGSSGCGSFCGDGNGDDSGGGPLPLPGS